jgi:hypothetical protein
MMNGGKPPRRNMMAFSEIGELDELANEFRL